MPAALIERNNPPLRPPGCNFDQASVTARSNASVTACTNTSATLSRRSSDYSSGECASTGLPA